ncbi:P-loop containing nucleoside triphosphate hydrolase protein [Lophium mytilinum]|uniref:P-loop containing nucleoside triphosphate hydrolase protein n=1 Tax=Lophium mytilinum TaxID=390894 RepID=A0A6A6QYQ7_9PEZI|nr:P-loop containing nucleoside triphosphate hydrolase protein [Lophium mytilinum]
MASAPAAALLLGISGPSSSGKTTLSRLLRDILPQSFILHLDDFYLEERNIPIREGVQDWDCIESLDLNGFREALSHIKKHGSSPPTLVSKEDQNAVGEHRVPAELIEELKQRVQALVAEKSWNMPIAIIDGFLLFSNEMADIRDLFDVRLFLRTSYRTAKTRREARTGYVTLEGFWEDPPGYVDQIVWPNYVKDHSFLFQQGDVEGELDEDVCKRAGIHGMPREAEASMEQCLEWALQKIEDAMSRRK